MNDTKHHHSFYQNIKNARIERHLSTSHCLHWSLIVNFKFNGIPQQPTKTKSNDSNKNITLAAFKETQNIEIASRTIKNEAEIKLARIGEILDPNFRKKKSGEWARFSLSWHFFVSKWILLKVGELISLVEFFRFLFLVFQCYRTVAYLLQSLQ